MGNPQLVAVDSDSYAFPATVLAALDVHIQTKLQQQYGFASARVDTYLSPDLSYEYEVVTVHAPGKAMNAALEKVYNGNYEKTWTTGAFTPGTSSFASFQQLGGGYITVSSDALQGGQMSGIQIKGGKLYSGWGNYSNDPRVGHEALALMKDGSWKTYTDTTSTAAAVAADGVDTTWGFGPLVVTAGVVRPDLGDSNKWTDWVTSLSGRHIMGHNAAGDAIFILVKGTTGTTGIAGVEMGNVALRHGCVNAIMLDGGGSVQGRSSYLFHPSSDAGGNRDVANAIVVKVPPMYPVTVAPTTITYASGVTAAANGYALTAGKRNGEVTLAGTAQIATIAANTWYTVGTLPSRLMPGLADDYRDANFLSTNGVPGVLSISRTTGVIQVKSGAAATNQYWQFDNVRFPALY